MLLVAQNKEYDTSSDIVFVKEKEHGIIFG
jgi:hypothetical protein